MWLIPAVCVCNTETLTDWEKSQACKICKGYEPSNVS